MNFNKPEQELKLKNLVSCGENKYGLGNKDFKIVAYSQAD
jgi:hypothetical protein